MSKKEIDQLVANVDPRAKVPRGFHLYSEAMAILWLKAHQIKKKPDAGHPLALKALP